MPFHRLKTRLATSAASLLPALALHPALAAPAPSDVAIGDPVALTFYLPMRNQAAAEAQARALQSPGSGYHKFLTVADFVAKYGATDNQIANLEAVLEGLGFTIEYTYPNHLAIEAVSLAGNVQSSLGVKLQRMTVNGRTGVVTSKAPTLPARLQGLVAGIGGLDTLNRPQPRHVKAAIATAAAPVAGAPAGTLLPSAAGTYLPADFAKFYDVNPLYAQGLTGRGATIGIVTLNDFDPADAYDFWKQIGLEVSPTRITKVNVDGGETASTNNADGEGETDLDVQESGGLAPDAALRVYVAPNVSNANFVNGFEAAASENIADTVSSSWGQPELDYFYDVATRTTGDSFLLQAFHSVFLEMALQGQTLFIAAGDSGSYDTVRGCPFYGTPSATAPTCNAPFSVDHPASDPLVTAAGGTTLPFSFTSKKSGIHFYVNAEQAWSWDYLSNEAAAQGKAASLGVPDVFSTGGGGGVSTYWSLPWYQVGVFGVAPSKTGQSFVEDSGSGPVTQVVLPANFIGRNLPDISANADPESGYQYIEEGGVVSGYGGTSFVAPQLNGVNALFTQALGGRVGQINPAIYLGGNLASPDVKLGDNWGYKATGGYDQTTGVGKLDAARLLTTLRLLKAL